MMDIKRIPADPNQSDDIGRVLVGTTADIKRYGIEPADGLVFKLVADDADEDGKMDPLLFEGVARYNSKLGFWVAEVDWNSYRNESRQEAYAEYMDRHQGRPDVPFVRMRRTVGGPDINVV
jgi:hypothetical protein